MRSLRIGYVPISPTLETPGDRRRFPYYAKKRNLEFEFATPDKSYDVVVATGKADLSVWSEYRPGRAKLVFDCIDSYLAVPRSNPKGLLRGLAKYLSGQSRRLQWNYWKSIENMARRADAVICSTEEQKAVLKDFCPNVHIILDVHKMYSATKEDYSCGKKFKLVWEGLPENLSSFAGIEEILREVHSKRPLSLNIVTNLEYKAYMGRFGSRLAADSVRKYFDDVEMHEWDEATAPKIISECDMAVIPIPVHDPLAAGKPENKLLLFWRMGLPVIVSATPAYARAMRDCGLDMACGTDDQWRETLVRYMSDEAARREAGRRGRAFAEKEHGEETILARWDRLFESVLSPSFPT